MLIVAFLFLLEFIWFLLNIIEEENFFEFEKGVVFHIDVLEEAIDLRHTYIH